MSDAYVDGILAGHLDALRTERDALKAQVAEMEAQAKTDDAHALVVNDAHLRTVAALRGRVAWLEAQWDEAVAALRGVVQWLDTGDDANHPSPMDDARAVLAKYPEGER